MHQDDLIFYKPRAFIRCRRVESVKSVTFFRPRASQEQSGAGTARLSRVTEQETMPRGFQSEFCCSKCRRNPSILHRRRHRTRHDPRTRLRREEEPDQQTAWPKRLPLLFSRRWREWTAVRSHFGAIENGDAIVAQLSVHVKIHCGCDVGK